MQKRKLWLQAEMAFLASPIKVMQGSEVPKFGTNWVLSQQKNYLKTRDAS